jgi:hypothetical protein
MVTSKLDWPYAVEAKKGLILWEVHRCTKNSAMKIIDDLEETKRGLYSGAVGYLRQMEISILM